jgi:hypothetical protein
MALIRRPIVIIGAGRSGTSLLDGVLGAHPEITMFGEFDGTVEQLWRQFWQVSAAQTQRTRRIEAIRQRAPEAPGTGDAVIFDRVRDLERQERGRVAAIIRSALDRFYAVTALPSRFWGYKEIWADIADWTAADTVFPEAHYLHIVRHPFDFARSSADWHRRPLTPAQLRADLAEWLRYLRLNGTRAETGRYRRLTYEALKQDPETALAGFFDDLGLDWAPSCGRAFGRRYAASDRQSPLPPGIAAGCEAVPGLAEAMAELGYALPIEPAIQVAAAQAAVGTVTQTGIGQWRLNPPFQADSGTAWTARLHMAPELAEFEGVSDNLEHPYRSPLRLLENGAALGPAHSLHALIRGNGQGRFSHWGPHQVLLFSTSDNSDPNLNGRTYMISV